MSKFRWTDILDSLDKPTGDAAPEVDAPYLGTSLEDGVLCHRWLDGTSLPVLAGGAGDDDDDTNDDDDSGDDDDDDDDDGDDESDDADDKSKGKKKKAKDDDDDNESTLTNKQRANLHRSARQAARHRIEAKTERARADTAEERATEAEERADALLVELAFTRAAGDRFADADAAWKLINKKLITVDDDGEVSGVDEAIDALIESHPFIVTADDDDKPSKKKKDDDNPFQSLASGSQMRGKKRPVTATTSEASLAKKYPALRNR